MRARYTERFRRSYADAPRAVQRASDRKVLFLQENLRHPSLRAKKYDEACDFWQARVTQGVAFLFPHRGRHLRDHRHHCASEVALR